MSFRFLLSHNRAAGQVAFLATPTTQFPWEIRTYQHCAQVQAASSRTFLQPHIASHLWRALMRTWDPFSYSRPSRGSVAFVRVLWGEREETRSPADRLLAVELVTALTAGKSRSVVLERAQTQARENTLYRYKTYKYIQRIYRCAPSDPKAPRR